MGLTWGRGAGVGQEGWRRSNLGPEKETRRSLRLLKEMESSGYAQNSLQKQEVEKAAQLMNQMLMEGLKPDKFTYNSMLTYFCRADDIKKAIGIAYLIGAFTRLVELMLQVDSLEVSMKGMVLTPHAYNPIIQALFRQKRAKKAVRLYKEMLKDDPPDAITYKIVFSSLCNGGRPT
ncbi:hypothetical protein DITRI_Ditri15bG0098300 [Diplodiscus trichospermus]